MSITPDLLRRLRAEIDAALRQVAAAHGLVITAGSARYTATDATFKLAVAVKTADAAPTETAEALGARLALRNPMRARALGADPSWEGRRVTVQGQEFEVVGLNVRKPKFSIRARRVSDGRSFSLVAADVQRQLGFPT